MILNCIYQLGIILKSIESLFRRYYFQLKCDLWDMLRSNLLEIIFKMLLNFINHRHHHYHVVPFARISLTFSLVICLNHPSFPAGLIDYILCPYRARPCERLSYDFVVIFPSVSLMCCSSNLDGFRDGR